MNLDAETSKQSNWTGNKPQRFKFPTCALVTRHLPVILLLILESLEKPIEWVSQLFMSGFSSCFSHVWKEWVRSLCMWEVVSSHITVCMYVWNTFPLLWSCWKRKKSSAADWHFSDCTSTLIMKSQRPREASLDNAFRRKTGEVTCFLKRMTRKGQSGEKNTNTKT